ncbi:G-type lectin S-receptor-like serine/threonine-protein kinase At4g03230 isoform X1 [Quercus suber]|uniref:G-type lectin S-receptor-like serine/threonine-protein kinase At4g03230 isoform X1 n=2 Tax=Quercus suber TaxID=58331 RepID=UPI000CE18B76|nr:G-type lectin S-receptor-like serine/threonine-protein kinase At4g03230 isoform X1 [Quercus suber]
MKMGAITVIKGWSANCMLCSMFILYIPVLLCSFHVYCADRVSLRYGERIKDHEETLVSPGRKFELGFFSPAGSSGYKRHVGIWYMWDKRTVVWVANRDDPLINTTTGAFGFAEDGNLQVWDTSTEKVHWYSECYNWRESCNSTDTIVNLTDSGNLVLYGYSYGNVTSLWESFKNPTDTFLPGMTLSLDENINLTSWRGRNDPGSGNFTFMLDAAGNQNAIIANKEETTTIYWESSAGLYAFLTSTEDQKDAEFENARLVMNFSGKIEYWVQSVRSTNGTWYLSDAEPSNNCSVYNVCGNFGSCNLNNKLKCKCLPGFKPYVAQKWHSGDFSDGCTKNSVSCGNTFLSLKMMKIGKNLEQRSRVENETECKELCLKHCDCKSYSYNQDYPELPCWIWKQELVDVQEEYEFGYNVSLRVAISDIEPTVQNCKPCGTNMIPYPLSTSSNCGDPMYFSFNCSTTSGQVSFKAPSGTYRVTSIDQNRTKFFIQVKDVGSLRLNQSLPFNQTTPRNSSSNVLSRVTDDVEIVWEPPLEPICNLSTDCKDWPHSTCKSASHGKRKCLCTKSFRWDGTKLSCTQVSSPSEKGMILLLIVGITSVIVLVAISFIYIWRRKMTKRQENRQIDQRNRVQRMLYSESYVQDLIDSGEFQEEDEKGIYVPFYDLESIRVATNNFSDENKLGQGGYGPVYKGKLPSGQEIAVKRLSSVSGQGLQEFKNEVVLIAKLQHRNLVRLYGYCIKGNEKILIYEYMANKSLDFFLFDQKQSVFLDWEMRFNIILGIARGLLYLHQDSRLRIIHRDLKTSNVLLDHEMSPKISDFGLARIVGGTQTEANTTKVAGTYGYMSPEYALDGIFSIKSDVFSFGVVLLEIISGKKNTGFYKSKQAMSLLSYAWRLWTDDKLLDLMDETIRDTCNADQFVKCLNIGLLCVQQDPSDRPTMSIIIKMLDGETVNLPTPKQPAFSIRRDQSSSTSSSRPESNNELTNSLEGR